ncbi:mycofactocin biosynthesis glycosyltransferase MftF [Mycolicibacillus parakoreensis]|uniref:Mycofactocin biosynthesis glycosyltransferase MftF n=1 Tax=Mycolicibacillus parakoreensis TaxID=1069221 RepID=A0ABY3TWR4_9MYCO|nr:mycofactocin biosynthesis glycosyltransferase MftF [Mycolicibacillus parakoreensis]MCV7315369.1 mycofactocin biosynthesis glycosyltransferase MftF [Mycolicibacillus parakoreensis]ULN52162.1 mycofactocin biosynthesis glycosyltransferase MftF [Mycolicibacillus parakoreensis]
MSQPRLPDGFAVQMDRRVRVLGRGSALLGGSPTRLLRLAPAAQLMLTDGRLRVHDADSARLARTLLDATVAHPRPETGPSHHDVTVVIPVRDNGPGVARLVRTLRGLRVIVVDDGSVDPVRVEDLSAADCTVEVLRHRSSRGPAAARNTGLRACTSDYVAFLDSDVVPRRGWLEALLGHFCDPTVALVAPRIVSLVQEDTPIARYEAVHSSLDLGGREAPVIPYSTVSYVPSAAIICRRDILAEIGGFDEGLCSGEDVDLCWRLVESGARLRYEPVALVGHDHRTHLAGWLSRKAYYGQSAAPLSVRHPDKTAPLVVSGWTMAIWAVMMLGARVGYPASLLLAALTGGRVARALRGPDTRPHDVIVVLVRGLMSSVLQLASALCREYWPLALIVVLVSRRCRQAVVVIAVVEGLVDWLRRSRAAQADVKPIGPLSYLLLKRLDDLAYGTGVWNGMVGEHSLRALRPVIRA